MGHGELVKLLEHLASLVVPLLSCRFPEIGSLYFGPNPMSYLSSEVATPKATHMHGPAFPFNSASVLTPKQPSRIPQVHEFYVGPIISWPFFGSNRGELVHPDEIDRGPWATTESYLVSCAQREIDGVIHENEGRAAPHRLHLAPDEILSSRHHHLKSVPGDESDESDEWDLQESEEEWEGPGDAMYRDYRRMQRSTFLIAHLATRVETVRREMQRWMRVTKKLCENIELEAFALDGHDLSLENIFVDEGDHSKIVGIFFPRQNLP